VCIAWHVKRPTSSAVKRMAAARAGNEQISMRAAGSEPGRRRASKATPAIYCGCALVSARKYMS